MPEQQNQIDVGAIRTDGGTQMREAISEATVERYAEHIQDGAEFPQASRIRIHHNPDGQIGRHEHAQQVHDLS